MELANSKRLLYSASYVTTQLTQREQLRVESEPGGGMVKANMVRALTLTAQDMDKLAAALDSQTRDDAAHVEALLSAVRQLAHDDRAVSTVRLASLLAPVPYSMIDRLTQVASEMGALSTAAAIGVELSRRRRKIMPIGRIHLERIEMYSAGVQRGELVFTVPMAPGETVAISHKEWSTSSREFEDIVQDFFESYSERGVAEKTDAAMSSESEREHSTAINFGASLSGSYSGVTLTTTLGIADTNRERLSVKASTQKTREATEKASARARKEHKVSVKLETKTGNEDHSAKTFTNTSASPVRIDYYRMMRKWRTDLYRYGLRQTYDIAIPLPGVRLWALHRRVAELETILRTPLAFSLKPGDLTDLNWLTKATEAGVPSSVPSPPAEKVWVVPPATIIDYIPEDQSGITRFGKIDFEVPAGYWLSDAAAIADLAVWKTQDRHWLWLNGSSTGNMNTSLAPRMFSDLNELRLKQSGPMAVAYRYRGVSFASLQLTLGFERTPDAFHAWQRAAWTAIKAGAEARHAEQLAQAQEERDRLWRLLNGKDTLSLRRLEREELMRLVMYWLLGPDNEVNPGGVVPGPGAGPTEPVQQSAQRLLANERSFLKSATPEPFPTFSGVTESAAQDAMGFGEWVKFMHQAVEWENLLYFLYPYFWGSEAIGREKLLFEHADPEHERFLRAGYARIVLPVRPGFEEEFTHLVENGTLSGQSTTPYLPIAQEIANFARTNYAGIPPANPELHARPLLYPEQRATWDTMQQAMVAIDAHKTGSGSYPATLADLASGAPVDAWGNELLYRVPGLGADYDLTSLGADGVEGGEGLDADISSAAGASLVATWFEYTPTSALDIGVDTAQASLA